LFPAPEPCPTPTTNTLSTTATIFSDSLGFQWARPLSLDEIARSYSHSPPVIHRLYSLPHLASDLPALLARTLPAKTAAYIADSHLIDALFPLLDTRDTRHNTLPRHHRGHNHPRLYHNPLQSRMALCHGGRPQHHRDPRLPPV